MTRLITVTSGKGGVGKTNISLNLALFIASKGFSVCLFDADLGLANINILLNFYPETTLSDVVLGNKEVDDVIIKNYEGIDIIPGSSGVEKMADLDISQMKALIKSFAGLTDYDYVIFDTSAGIAKNVISFCMAATDPILVITPEPTSLTDAYALLKVLYLNNHTNTVKVIVNQAKNIKSGKIIYQKFEGVVKKFLDISIEHMATIVSDSHVPDAVRQQQPFMSLYPNSNASRCIKNVGQFLFEETDSGIREENFVSFWKKYLGFIRKPLKLKMVKEEKKIVDPYPLEDEVPVEPPPVSSQMEKAVLKDTEADTIEPSIPGTYSLGEDKDIKVLFGTLVDSISAISKDLKAIRNISENFVRAKEESSAYSGEKTGVPDGEQTQSSVIYLDFEDYLNRHKEKK